MKNYDFTAYIEKDKTTGLYFVHVPHLQGVHTQEATLDELPKNLQEVISLYLEETLLEEKKELNDFVGMQKVSVRV